MDALAGNAVTGGPSLRVGIPGLLAPFHLGIPLGIARGALDEFTTQAKEKARGFPPSPLIGHAHVQLGLGKAELELASARALAVEVLSEAFEQAEAGKIPPPPMQAKMRAAATYVTDVAKRVVAFAFESAGAGALFDTNPLQRRLRDVTAAGQHMIVNQTAYQALGQFTLGVPDANPML